MAKIFRAPTYRYKLGRPNDLWFVSYPKGKTVIKRNGVWSTVITPQDSFLQECERALRGGYEEPITDAEAVELTAAGYGDYIFDV
jgi:hypothetical protein